MASTTDQPVILLVSGAWHLPDYWQKVKEALQAAGYEVHAPQLRTVVESQDDQQKPQELHTWRKDVALIHELVLPLFEQGRRVLAVGHSYGGFAMTPAIEGQTVSERAAQGLKGGFCAALFIASFPPAQKGLSVMSLSGGEYWPWAEAGVDSGSTTGTLVRIRPELQPFYHDLPEVEAKYWTAKLQPQSQVSLEEPTPFCANDITTIPMTYMICETDMTVPVQYQDMMASLIPAMRTVRCTAGHSPMLSQPDRTVEVIVEAAKGGA